jgi:hypothetical protein
MRRAPVAAFLATFLVGLAVIAVLLVTRESTLVYTIGAAPARPVAQLGAGQEACQGSLSPPADAFDRVVVGAVAPPGSRARAEVIVRAAGSPKVLARGSAGAAASPELAVPVPSTTVREPVRICVRAVDRRPVTVLGTTDLAHRTSSAVVDGAPVPADLAVRLERSQARSLLARLPAAVERAALFKGSVVGPATLWVLALLVLVAVPALIARALAVAARHDA